MPASAESTDPLAMSTLLLDAGVTGILVGAGDPPAADERRALGELAALVAAAAGRRPEIPVVLAGGMAEHLTAFGDVSTRPGEVLLGPAARRGLPGGPLAELLIEVALPVDDARRSLGPGAMALAEVLDRRIDVVEIGYDAGTRAAATPSIGGGPSTVELAIVPTAALALDDPDDAVVDRVGLWSTWGADRHRLRDRLRELRIAPWADATGRGRDAPHGGRPGRPRPARRMDAGMGRSAAGRSRRRDRRRVGGRGGPDGLARPGRRPAPPGRRPVRPGPRPDPGAARFDPRSGRAAGHGRRPHR